MEIGEKGGGNSKALVHSRRNLEENKKYQKIKKT